MTFFKKTEKGIYLNVKIQPNSSVNKIIKIEKEHLKIKINAPAEKNKANLELISFLSKVLSLRKTDIVIVSGQTSRLKKIFLENISNEELLNKIYTNVTSPA